MTIFNTILFVTTASPFPQGVLRLPDSSCANKPIRPNKKIIVLIFLLIT